MSEFLVRSEFSVSEFLVRCEFLVRSEFSVSEFLVRSESVCIIVARAAFSGS